MSPISAGELARTRNVVEGAAARITRLIEEDHAKGDSLVIVELAELLGIRHGLETLAANLRRRGWVIARKGGGAADPAAPAHLADRPIFQHATLTVGALAERVELLAGRADRDAEHAERREKLTLDSIARLGARIRELEEKEASVEHPVGGVSEALFRLNRRVAALELGGPP
jgi:hypothetical protein